MNRRKVAAALVITGAIVSSPCRATTQPVAFETIVTEPPIASGATMRVGMSRSRSVFSSAGPRREPRWWAQGRVRSARGDTLLLAFGFGLTRAIPLSPSSVLLLKDGHRSRVFGAARGAAVGALGSFLLGVTISEAFHGSFADAVTLSGIVMPYGVSVGAAIGTLLPGPRWVRVQVMAKL